VLDPIPVEKLTAKKTLGGTSYTNARIPRDEKIYVNEISVKNQRLANEASKKLGLDTINLDTEFIYKGGYKPRFTDGYACVDYFRRV